MELLLSGTQLAAPDWIPTRRVDSFDAYRSACLETAADLGIFSAAVADYQPEKTHDDKLPSGEAELTIGLVPTSKVVEAWRRRYTQAKLVSFKLEAGLDDNALLAIARERVGAHSDLVVANHARGGEVFLVGSEDPHQVVPRAALAKGLVDWALSALEHPL